MRQKELTPAEIKERGKEQAQAQRELDSTQDAHRLASSKVRMKVKTLRDRLSQLAEEVDTGLAWISAQTELFEGVTSDGKDPKRKKGKRGTTEEGSESWSEAQRDIFEGKSKGNKKLRAKRVGNVTVLPVPGNSQA